MRTFRLVILSLLLLAACRPGWYYPQLDWLLPMYISDYVSLASVQKNELGKRLKQQLAWHCQTQLPVYAGFLRSVGKDFESQDHIISEQQFQAYYTILRGYWKDVMVRVAPDAADLLISASNEQIEELFRNIEERNQELEDLYVNPPLADIHRNRADRMSERLEKWIGKLDAGQQRLVREWSYRPGSENTRWMANRRHLQQAFRDLLSERRTDPAFKQQFVNLLLSPETLRSESYKTLLAEQTRLTFALLARIAASLSTEQQRYFQETLASLAGDFDRLTCPDPRTVSR